MIMSCQTTSPIFMCMTTSNSPRRAKSRLMAKNNRQQAAPGAQLEQADAVHNIKHAEKQQRHAGERAERRERPSHGTPAGHGRHSCGSHHEHKARAKQRQSCTEKTQYREDGYSRGTRHSSPPS